MFAFIDWCIKLLTASLDWGSFQLICLTGIGFLFGQKQTLLSRCGVGYWLLEK